MKRLLIALLMTTMTFTLLSVRKVSASDSIPYSTFTYSSSLREFVPTQDAYLPLSSQTNLGNVVLSAPNDITIDKNDNVYISDSGRIIKYNLQNDETSIIGESVLNNPSGVHVDLNGNIYVADIGNNEAYKFEYNIALNNYELTVTYKKPVNTPFFANDEPFTPAKIVVDRSGIVYVLLGGNINGLGKFTNEGEFTGFFGGNQIPATFTNLVRNLVFNEQQRREWFQMIPKPVYNVGVDHDGLILTTTKGERGYLKLNIANNVLNSSNWGYEDIEDIFVGPNNTIFTISQKGYITEYAPDGSTLFIFSGTDQNNQKGLFRNATGIAVDSKNNIYAIDSETRTLKVFIPTEFANLVHLALDLYQDGQYAISLEPWQEVLKRNSLFDVANKGIGDAHFALGDYEKAMESYMVARDRNGYSEAFWEVRNIKLLNSGAIIISTLLILLVLYILNAFLPIYAYVKMPFKKGHDYLLKFKIYQELIFGFKIIKKPVDGFYGVKREGKSSNFTALIYLLVFFIVYIIWIYNTNFLFNNHIAAEIDLVEQIMFVFVPFGLWVVANYLVCSIRDGEGSLSNVFQATAYSLLPMIITLPILTIVSQGLTLNESFIYTTILYIGIGITVFYFIMMVKEIHFYDGKQTFVNILISLFTAIMILAFVAIVYLLLNEIFGFFIDLYKEVISRG